LEKVVFYPEGDEPTSFYVLDQTTIAGKTYILVTDTKEGDGQAMILRDVSVPGDQESLYEAVTEETELSAVAEVFGSMLEDVEFVEEDSE